MSNSAKFSAGRPLLPAYIFSATMASISSTYHFAAVVTLKFSAIENMPPISVKLRLVDSKAASARFANGTVLDRSGPPDLFTMAIRLSTITNFYSSESKLVERGENALKSNRLLSFTYDGTDGVIKATVQPSMKKGSYTVTV